MSELITRLNHWRNQEVYIPLPFRSGSHKKQGHVIYEVLPSLHHNNQGIETLLHAMHVLGNQNLFKKESFGLEIYANKERIQYHFVSPESHAPIIQQRIQHVFRGSGVSPSAVDYASTFSSSHYALALGLEKEAFLPISTDKNARMFDTLTSILEHLSDNEQVMIQVLLQAADDDWQRQFKKQYESWLSGENTISRFGVRDMLQLMLKGFTQAIERMGRSLMRLDPDKEPRRQVIPGVKYKLNQQGFHTSIKAVVDAESYERRQQIASSITGAFKVLARDNDFVAKPVLLKSRNLKHIQERRMPLVTINNQILSTGEVANILKLPDEKVETPKLKRMTPEERRVDESITKEGMLIGETTHTERKPVHLSTAHDDDTSRIKLFVASPGAGKSTLIEQLVYEGAKRGHGAAVFDIADGSLYERLIQILPEYKDKIVCINYADEENPPAFNFSALGGDEDSRGLFFSEFFEIFFATGDLARTQSYLLKAAITVFSQPDSTLLEFIKILRDDDFRTQFIPKIRATNPDLYLWWMHEFPKIGDRRLQEIIAPILVRLDNFLYNTKMKNILCQKGGSMNPAQWMEEGKIVLFNLPNGTFTEPEQRMLMSLHNSMFWNATLAREKFKVRRPFHIFYDEPQSYINATPMASRAISKARKYRVSLNFFIQEAEQLIKENSALWKEIIGMSPHLFVGPVSEYTAKQLKRELNMDEEEILSIKRHKYHWILRTFHNKESLNPIVFQAVAPRDVRGEVKDFSHTDYVIDNNKHFSVMSKKDLREDISARNMGKSIQEYRMLLNSYTETDEDISWE